MNATEKMTYDRAYAVYGKTLNDYRERCMDRQAERDGWLKTNNDWQGWDSQVRFKSAEEMRDEHAEELDDAPRSPV